MTDRIEGYLEVWCNSQGEVVLSYSDPTLEEDSVHVVFSPNQARNAAALLVKYAEQAESGLHELTAEQKKAVEDFGRQRQEWFDRNPPRGLRQSEQEASDKAKKVAAELLKSVPPVDRSARMLSNGAPVPEDESHRELDATGQQKGYVVLTPAERAKGFVRPVRLTYVHVGKPAEGQKFEYPIRKIFKGGCGTRTTMAIPIAETYARDPGFYNGGTFCCSCRRHVPLEECVWEGTTEQVGS